MVPHDDACKVLLSLHLVFVEVATTHLGRRLHDLIWRARQSIISSSAFRQPRWDWLVWSILDCLIGRAWVGENLV
jgi:hypothetical protein